MHKVLFEKAVDLC